MKHIDEAAVTNSDFWEKEIKKGTAIRCHAATLTTTPILISKENRNDRKNS